MLPRPEQTSQKRLLFTPMVVLALLAAAAIVEVKWVKSALTSIHIFRQTESGWQQMPAPAGLAPDVLHVSSSGTVWVLTLNALSRWDGTAWRHYDHTDFGSKTSYMIGAFALDGEQVWAPTTEGVLHWDGQDWRLYREVAKNRGASIVAGSGEVWVIDHGGNLSHYQGGQWASRVWPDHQGTGSPELARTADGAVWLVWKGIWRFDGANWTPLAAGTDRLAGAKLVGSTGDRLWLSDSSGLRSVSMDAKDWAVYPHAQTGLGTEVTVYDVASAGDRTWFATSTGLLEFDGSLWRRVPLLFPGGVTGAHRIAAEPDGALWVVGLPPAGPLRTFLVPLTILTPVAMVGVIIWAFWRLRRRRLQQHQLVTQAVQHATGEIPEELEKGASWFSGRGEGLITIVAIIGGIVGFALLRRVWPAMPGWTVGVLIAAIYLAVIFQQSLVKRRPKPSDPTGPGAPSRYDWGKTWKAVAGGLLLLLFLNADRLPILSFLRGYYFWMLVLVPAGYHALGMNLMNGAARRGDYDGALKIIRWFHFYNPSGMEALRMSGHILLLAGRYREAEDTLRRSLTGSQARDSYGSALEYLGDALMEQGRYDEATRSYEAALHAFSWLRRPFRGMAEMLLRQEKNPQQALAYVERIIDLSSLSWRERQSNGRPQDDYWALKAWALARLGRSSEVAPAIENALSATDKKVLPDLATTHYRAGMAMQALGNLSSANEHFSRAVELDPHGRRGSLAKAALREGSVWGSVRV